jgi:hypothetical protein
VFAAYALAFHHGWALLWTLLSWHALASGRTDIACSGGCLYVIGLISGVILSPYFGVCHAIGGLIAIASYAASSILRCSTVYEVGLRIRASADDYDRLMAEDLILLVAKSQISPSENAPRP